MDINSEDFNEVAELIAIKHLEHKEIVFINIGTDIIIGDSFGPLLGTMIEESGLNNFYSYGNLDNPITAVNLESRVIEIKEKHPNAYIIGTDACISSSEDKLNKLIFRKDLPISPGKGVGKDLKSVGHSSIIYILKDRSYGNPIFAMTDRQDRLRHTYNSAKKIISLLRSVDNIIDKRIGA